MTSQNSKLLSELAQKYKAQLSEKVREFLMSSRVLSQRIIEAFDLGVKGSRVSIPIRSSEFEVEDIRLYLPDFERSKKNSSKFLSEKGGNGSPKIFPTEVFWLLKLKSHFDGTEKIENVDLLKSLERLIPVMEQVLIWDTIFLVEGELDALAMLSQGLLAITNTCGAKSWNSEFAQRIAQENLKVIICLDADCAGEDGTQERAETLYAANTDVFTVAWPNEKKNGHDVTDEIRDFGIDSLVEILERAKPFRDVIYLNEVVAEEVDWLFSPYIPVGKTSLLEGHPGIGKTFLTLRIAASVTTGKGLKDQEEKAPAVVLLLSAEDGLADTIKPRLEKMEVDLSKIITPRELFTLDDKGFESLRNLVEKYKPKLVIIDPMMPFLDGKKDSNKASDMRPFFKNLGKIAERNRCAMVVTRHLAKNPEQKGVTSGLGSIDISAAVRSILQVSEDTEDKRLKKVHHIKCNIGTKGSPFGYRIEDGFFKWADIPPEEEAQESNKKEISRACDFIMEVLKQGPMSSAVIEEQAAAIDISKSTLNRAKKMSGVSSKRITDANGVSSWQWYLWKTKDAGSDSQDVQDSQESNRDA